MKDCNKFEEIHRETFEDLKKTLGEAPPLGIPNIVRPFTMFVNKV